MKAPVRRYPVQPLLDATGMTLNGFIRMHVQSVNGGAYRKIRDEGLTAEQADKWAVKVGIVAYDIWPELLDDNIQASTVSCEECGGGFIPTRKGHRFCTTACARRKFYRERNRERYATEPEFRAKEIARARRYREEAARAIRAQQDRYRREHADQIRRKRREYYERNRELILEKQREYDRARAARKDAA